MRRLRARNIPVTFAPRHVGESTAPRNDARRGGRRCVRRFGRPNEKTMEGCRKGVRKLWHTIPPRLKQRAPLRASFHMPDTALDQTPWPTPWPAPITHPPSPNNNVMPYGQKRTRKGAKSPENVRNPSHCSRMGRAPGSQSPPHRLRPGQTAQSGCHHTRLSPSQRENRQKPTRNRLKRVPPHPPNAIPATQPNPNPQKTP